jgi:uncharacterized protein
MVAAYLRYMDSPDKLPGTEPQQRIGPADFFQFSPLSLTLLAIGMMALFTAAGAQLGATIVGFLYGFDLPAGTMPGTSTPERVEATKLFHALVQVFGFGGATLLVASLMRNFSEGLRIPAKAFQLLLGSLVLALVAMPFVESLVLKPEDMNLPEFAKGFETWAKTQESGISVELNAMLRTGLWLNLLCIALIPALMEEFFFRGVLMRLMRGYMPAEAAVWVSAIVFSLLHFQFLGFLPRVLLGAMFGYLTLWSGSLWLAVVAHFTHNAISIVLAWASLNNQWGLKESFTSEYAFPWYVAVLSGVFGLGVLLGIRRMAFAVTYLTPSTY